MISIVIKQCIITASLIPFLFGCGLLSDRKRKKWIFFFHPHERLQQSQAEELTKKNCNFIKVWCLYVAIVGLLQSEKINFKPMSAKGMRSAASIVGWGLFINDFLVITWNSIEWRQNGYVFVCVGRMNDERKKKSQGTKGHIVKEKTNIQRTTDRKSIKVAVWPKRWTQ